MSRLPLGVGGAFYINLDHRTDRRAEVEAELEKMGIPCERFPAVKWSPGIVGCNYSHIAVLKEARNRGYDSVLIFEDDFQFIVDKDTFWSTMSSIEREVADSYDVVMLSYNAGHESTYKPYSDNLIKILGAQTTSGYIVHSRMYDDLINIWEMATPKLIETGQHWIYALDQIWKRLQPGSNWYASKIRLGLQRPSFSDIGQKFVENGC
jgi:GR25 family glycosyltransferase involved in LPS biosynthesis